MQMRSLLGLLFSVSLTAGAQDKKASFKNLFDSLEHRQNFNGSVLVAENGRPVYQRSIGYANQEKKTPLNAQTLFEIASVAKQFTAVAIMQLKEKGKLQYDDSLRHYFPELPFPGVTIRHLLTHTSGIPDFLAWNSSQMDPGFIHHNADIRKLLRNKGGNIAFAPGTAYQYSNSNYLLLADIVEQVSQQSFATYLQQHLFKPAGMTTTQVYSRRSAAKPLPNYALSYAWNPDINAFQEPDSTDNRYSFIMDGIAGPYGISSNVIDLLKWDDALYTEQLLKQSTLQEAFAPVTLKEGFSNVKEFFKYGFGWIISPTTGNRINVWHNGGLGGYVHLMVRYPDKKQVTILLTNHTPQADINQVAVAVENILEGRPYTLPPLVTHPRTAAVPETALQQLEGVYEVDGHPAFSMTVVLKQQHLQAQLTGQDFFRIYPSSADTFFYTTVDARLTFTRDATGRGVKLTLHQNGNSTPMTRK
ncbi:serine hydrolase [Chitinophaga nivalis]|uniref:Serine hydrolase n=1 Tax=Chitinophaga nivalis TaxID=2991709 RepID=A0ABT3IP85_9BACT|nr:serine hydrolase [Chitinophaga nivalis]MCW3464603.1 serine hydrolase [Chitinophaga nivalis]MCW3485706.1 serine hydrolase [Chitinophaga nivalis]